MDSRYVLAGAWEGFELICKLVLLLFAMLCIVILTMPIWLPCLCIEWAIRSVIRAISKAWKGAV